MTHLVSVSFQLDADDKVAESFLMIRQVGLGVVAGPDQCRVESVGPSASSGVSGPGSGGRGHAGSGPLQTTGGSKVRLLINGDNGEVTIAVSYEFELWI